ncbi:hypothetical protein BH11ACT2_BH11ACT2_17130 [soil metagenome]
MEALVIDISRYRTLKVVLAICLLFVAVILLITLSSKAFDITWSAQVNTIVLDIRGAFHAPWFTRGMLEKGSNILLFVPLGAALVVGLGARRWLLATGIAAGLSAAIELAQLVFLHGRTASVTDFVLNSLGAVVGVGIGRLALTMWRRRK